MQSTRNTEDNFKLLVPLFEKALSETFAKVGGSAKFKYVPEEYDLELMSNLPSNDKNQATTGKIYLSSDGTYIVRDAGEVVKTGSLKDSNINLSDLTNRLMDETLKKRILEVTSKAGHTLLECSKGRGPGICAKVHFPGQKDGVNSQYIYPIKDILENAVKLSNDKNRSRTSEYDDLIDAFLYDLNTDTQFVVLCNNYKPTIVQLFPDIYGDSIGVQYKDSGSGSVKPKDKLFLSGSDDAYVARAFKRSVDSSDKLSVFYDLNTQTIDPNKFDDFCVKHRLIQRLRGEVKTAPGIDPATFKISKKQILEGLSIETPKASPAAANIQPAPITSEPSAPIASLLCKDIFPAVTTTTSQSSKDVTKNDLRK